jgi:rhodanese-related sulfurtransferase
MKTNASTALRDVAVCVLAALVSLGVGLAVRRHQAQASPSPTAASSETTTAAPVDHAPLSLAEFRAAAEDGKTLVIDARDDVAYARGHVPRSLSLPNRRFDAGYARLRSRLEADRDRPIALYCANTFCGDSTEVQARLRSLGFTNVAVFPDGWDAWKAAGHTEEKSDVATAALAPWKNPS